MPLKQAKDSKINIIIKEKIRKMSLGNCKSVTTSDEISNGSPKARVLNIIGILVEVSGSDRN